MRRSHRYNVPRGPRRTQVSFETRYVGANPDRTDQQVNWLVVIQQRQGGQAIGCLNDLMTLIFQLADQNFPDQRIVVNDHDPGGLGSRQKGILMVEGIVAASCMTGPSSQGSRWLRQILRHLRTKMTGGPDRSCVTDGRLCAEQCPDSEWMIAEHFEMANPTRTAKQGPPIGELHEVRGKFSSSEQMQEAIQRLSAAGFDRADLSVPEDGPPVERSTPESGAMSADTEDDARQARTLHTSTAAAMAALAGAGVTVATGGAAAAAVAAAVAAGAAVGGATYAVSSAANDKEQEELDARASLGQLILSARTPTEAQRSKAEAILRDAGATDVQGS
jgi:hypothetical protein